MLVLPRYLPNTTIVVLLEFLHTSSNRRLNTPAKFYNIYQVFMGYLFQIVVRRVGFATLGICIKIPHLSKYPNPRTKGHEKREHHVVLSESIREDHEYK